MPERITYTVRYACGCTCGHRHRSRRAAEPCKARATTHHAKHADRIAPGRAWGIEKHTA